MMGALVGALLGLGGLLILLAVTSRPVSKPQRLRAPDAAGLAGLGNVRTPVVAGACVIVGMVVGLIVLAITSLPIVGVLAAVAGAWLPIGVIRKRARGRRRALMQAWPDAVDTLVSAVRAGMSLPEAVADLGVRGPEVLRPAFEEFGTEYRATGSFGRALEGLHSRLADPVADRVIVSLRIARDVGGTDLARVLTTLSDFLRDDARSRGEIEARQGWTVNAARIAVAAPWITLGLLCTRVDAVAAYSTPTGAVVIVVCAVLSVLAYRGMMMVGSLPAEQRILR